MCIIVHSGVACGAHVFTKLKFANTFLDQFANFNAHQITGYTVDLLFSREIYMCL